MTTLHQSSSLQGRIPRITVLISGSGSNLQALLDASQTARLPGQVTHVISSRSNVYGLERARKHSPPIPSEVCALKTFLNRHPGSTREDYDAEVARRVLVSKPDMVVLAGWMHILSDAFLDILNGVTPPPAAPSVDVAGKPSQTGLIPSQQQPTATSSDTSLPHPPPQQTFPIPIINLHPALPGAFDGANAIGRAFEAFKNNQITKTGVMVHRVVREVDRGEPLVVRDIEIRNGESIEALEARIHEVEHEIIVEGARRVLEELAR
ncbi:formyl transferase-domain-containing protein [Naematelia encephala]|uniref:phosphoribosylglycinamide formyltransferase 1 n=1 Tax=Naematelia encephala TaxID=71784 RepID=A0A1Y2BA15_9TREE|nr:formyl transferase-domain-containing protein [Naematelia encephala]